ncbi:unnamed protein product, partial [Staurois parvus]
VLPISATYQCQSVPPISAISTAYQCHLSVPPINAIYECCPSVPIIDACQCPSVPTTSASSSVPINAASLVHISEGEKSLIYKSFKKQLRKYSFFHNF